MNHDLKAIPTRYRSTEFESRLAARWAAFFDLMGWRWTYQDRAVGRWIPDFTIFGPHGPVAYTDVPLNLRRTDPDRAKKEAAVLAANPRPSGEEVVAGVWCEAVAEDGQPDQRSIRQPIRYPPDILLLDVGVQQTESEWFSSQAVNFGQLGEFCYGCKSDTPEFVWDDCMLASYGGLGFCHAQMSYWNRITGQQDGDSGVGGSDLDAAKVLRLWREAGNAVQWYPGLSQTSIKKEKHTAVPTEYAGVHFRSRLEARWAMFFDLAGKRWDYEPFDLDGWTPDFVIWDKQPILAEVKPFRNNRYLPAAYGSDWEPAPNNEVEAAYAKALAHRQEHNILCLGCEPNAEKVCNPGYLLGARRGSPHYWYTINDDFYFRYQHELWAEVMARFPNVKSTPA